MEKVWVVLAPAYPETREIRAVFTAEEYARAATEPGDECVVEECVVIDEMPTRVTLHMARGWVYPDPSDPDGHETVDRPESWSFEVPYVWGAVDEVRTHEFPTGTVRFEVVSLDRVKAEAMVVEAMETWKKGHGRG